MKYEIVELTEFSGVQAGIYSVIVDQDSKTLFDYFVEENSPGNREELKSIISRLTTIANETGAREVFFKHKEGKPGDGVCALYDDPDAKLRLYCIRYGKVAVILGGGGPKPPGIDAWQDDKKLTLEAETMIKLSADIMKRLTSGELEWSEDGTQLLGDLKINDEE